MQITQAGVLYCLIFMKHDFVTIYTARDDSAVYISPTGSGRLAKEKFVEQLLADINEANPD